MNNMTITFLKTRNLVLE